MMERLELVEAYKKLNSSYKKVLIFRVGIDAGFFTEYDYMIKAIAFCLENHIQFKLYSNKANFAYASGWTDYFEPFCDEVSDKFHNKYNLHKSLPIRDVIVECKKQHSLNTFLWKVKSVIYSFIGRCKALLRYGKLVKLTHNVSFKERQHYEIPDLGINGDFGELYKKLVQITWRFNPQISESIANIKQQLNISQSYVGCQIRGGDKITETNLIAPDLYVKYIRQINNVSKCFVLTDDYSIYDYLKNKYTDIEWLTLCSEMEHGYVNKDFSKKQGLSKKEQMTRFFASMSILQNSMFFIGTIMTGPCCFLFRILSSNDYLSVDCDHDNICNLLKIPIKERVKYIYK